MRVHGRWWWYHDPARRAQREATIAAEREWQRLRLAGYVLGEVELPQLAPPKLARAKAKRARKARDA